MLQPGQEYESLGAALGSLGSRFLLPMDRFIGGSTLLADLYRGTGQRTLGDFTCRAG